MPEEESSSIVTTISLLFRAMRYLLVALNSIVIVFVLYFLFSGDDLGGNPLQMRTWLRVIFCLLVILTSIYGIVVAFWKGKKTKFHLKLIGGYLIAIATWALLGIILAATYVRRTNKYDVIFIVATCFIVFLLTTSSLAFGYALKKTKLLRRLNVISSD